MSSVSVSVGDIVAEKYLIERLVTESAASRVYAARHVVLDQLVAIKLANSVAPEAANIADSSVSSSLRPSTSVASLSPAFGVNDAFHNAARAAARLQSAHVCRVLDIGTHAGTSFIVMEYLDGSQLAQELELNGRLSWRDAFECVLQACDALAEAHSVGIVHGDLQPTNLFWAVLPDGSRHIKVLGFGSARSSSTASVSGSFGAVRASGGVGGGVTTPAYLAPEQLDSTQTADERTDIWALAIVLYELVSGRPPFQGASLPAIVSAVLTLPPRPLAGSQAEVPAGVDAVLAKALSKRRELRYASIAEFVSALVPFAPSGVATTGHGSMDVSRALGSTYSAMGTATTATHSPLPGATTSAAVTGRGARAQEQQVTRNQGARYGVALVVVLLAACAGFAVLQWGRAELASLQSTPPTMPVARPRPQSTAAPETSVASSRDAVAVPAAPVPAVSTAAVTATAAPVHPAVAPSAVGVIGASDVGAEEPELPRAFDVPARAPQPRHGSRGRSPGGTAKARTSAILEPPAPPEPAPGAADDDVSDFGGRR